MMKRRRSLPDAAQRFLFNEEGDDMIGTLETKREAVDSRIQHERARIEDIVTPKKPELLARVHAALTSDARRKPNFAALSALRDELIALGVPTNQMRDAWTRGWHAKTFYDGDVQSEAWETFLADLEFLSEEIIPRMTDHSPADAWILWRESMAKFTAQARQAPRES